MSVGAAVASAPCSFGIFDLEPGLPDPDQFLAAVRQAGYDAVDLGPPGYLGEGSSLRERLERHGLALCGGWIQLAADDDLASARASLDAFAAIPAGVRPPVPTLALDGPPSPIAGAPARLDASDWLTYRTLVMRAAALCRERGFEPAFHQHVGTWIEHPDDLDRLLEETDIGLCLDTGHLLLAGGDPIAVADRWGVRLRHVHLKDVRLDLARPLDGQPLQEIWRRGIFCELGEGALDLPAFLAELGDYAGWLVVEQDRIVAPGQDLSEATAAQARNRSVLRRALG
jgi:inosose dehydratase